MVVSSKQKLDSLTQLAFAQCNVRKLCCNSHTGEKYGNPRCPTFVAAEKSIQSFHCPGNSFLYITMDLNREFCRLYLEWDPGKRCQEVNRIVSQAKLYHTHT